MNLLNKRICYAVLVLFFFLSIKSFSQGKEDFVYKKLDSSLIEQYYNYNYKPNLPKDAFLAEKVLNQKQSTVVNTIELQKSLNTQQIVVLPNYPITIGKDGISLNSNNTLIFQSKSQLIMEANDLDRYQLIRIHDVSNVKVVNAKLKGDRQAHSRTTGEWGYGISISTSNNVVIENAKIEGFWGDGIAIGDGRIDVKKNFVNNITLKNIYLDNNRRNGLSILNVRGLNIDKLLVSNTNGTEPMFGIDIEPNNANANLEDIKFSDVYTYNNANGGFMITFNKMRRDFEKKIEIVIDNYTDVQSLNGFYFAGVPKEAVNIQGFLKINGLVLKNNGKQPLTGKVINTDKFKVLIDKLMIVEPVNKNIHKKEVKRVFDTKLNYNIKFKD